jgi:DNA-binding transcriptional LysR family regulator
MLNPIHLQTLGVVVATGSFASAARELGYTSSAVSQQMDALERSSGLALFDRGARGVQVTAAARMLADRAREVLSTLQELDADVRSIAAGRTGRLKVGCFPTAGTRILPKALSTLKETHPGIEIGLRVAEPNEIAVMVEAGELDVAFTFEYATLGRKWAGNVVETRLLEEQLVFLTSADMEVGRKDSAGEMVRLSSEGEWITSGAGTGGESTTYRVCADLGFVPNVTLRTEYYDLVTEFVASGLGVAIVPALGIVTHERVKVYPVQSKWATRTVSIIHRPGSSNPLVQVVIDSFVTSTRSIDWGPHIKTID